MKKPVVLMILDGYGLTEEKESNAVHLANTPNIDNLWSTYPNALGTAHGLDVGLPEGQMGNSEVGHTNIGAGRVVYQELTRISKAITDGDFFTNEVLSKACESNTVHIMGLLSDGGVHSHDSHLYATLRLAKQKGAENIIVHAFLDGRDTSPTSGASYLQNLMPVLEETGAKLGSVMGRYYSMDRDNREERTKEAFDALTLGIGEKVEDAAESVRLKYKEGVTDEFIKPLIISPNKIKDGDSVIFINFRPDRARQLSRMLVENINIKLTTFTDYDPKITPKEVAFKKQNLKNTLGEVLYNNNKTQFRIAETEKYPHVTFFFNGGLEEAFDGEERKVVPSPKVATYDLMPEMSAPEVTENLREAILSKKYDFLLVNYANPDMVGHTGNLEAVIKGVEEVDRGVGLIYEAIKEVEGIMLICADHGNADKMWDYTNNEPHTAHTTNLVPLILVNSEYKEIKNGRLCDIAPTILNLMNLDKPSEMDGVSLI